MSSSQHTLGSTLRACVIALDRARRWTPLLLAIDVVANVVMAVIPAGQVLAVTWLGTQISRGQRGMLLLPVLATALSVCATNLISGLVVDIDQSLSSEQHTHFLSELRDVIAHMPASDLADDETATRVQAARSAVDYTMNGMADNVIRVLSAAVTAMMLLAAIWPNSPLAAVLVVAALIPTTISYSRVAGFRRQIVHEMNAHERSQRYFTDQIVYQRSGTELASLGTAPRMAAWADVESERNTVLVHQFTRRSARGRTIASAATLALVGGALFSLAQASTDSPPPLLASWA